MKESSQAAARPWPASGWSFQPYRLFQKDAARHSVARMGFQIRSGQAQRRADSVIGAFFHGYNSALADASPPALKRVCEGQVPFLRPFSYEGAALGCFVRSFMRPGPSRYPEMIDSLCRIHPDYLYLYYMGLGFGCGILLRWWPRKAQRIMDSLSPLHRHLGYDGFGFQSGLFHFMGNPSAVRRFHRFQDPFAVHCCYQGLGRSLRFLYYDSPRRVQQVVSGLQRRYHSDCYMGLGLAFAFTHIDSLGTALEYCRHLEQAGHRMDFLTGIALALWARRLNHAGYFEEQVTSLPRVPRSRIERLIGYCDECNELVDETAPDSYRQWRSCVRARLKPEEWS